MVQGPDLGVDAGSLMTLLRLSDVVRSLRARPGFAAASPAVAPDELKLAAAILASYVYGEEAVLGQPALINCGALALLLPREVTHEVTAAAAARVDGTDLHSLPEAPTRLLRGPWIVEARDPERERLFGDTICLAGYPLEGAIFLIGLQAPDGVRVARWRPRWTGGDLPADIPTDSSVLIDDQDAHREWAREAARWIVVLSVLLEAEGSPVREGEAVPVGGRRRGTPTDGPAVRRVYLEEVRRPGGAGAAEGAGTDGKLGLVVPVSGHVKRQRYGAGRTETRWIYVAGYEGRRWVAPRARVIVGSRPN